MRTITAILFIVISVSLAHAQKIDTQRSKTKFSVSNLGFRTVEGTISGIQGNVIFNPTDLSSSIIDVTLDVSTINTDNEKRDEHLKKEDFFEVKTYPTI